ncbi:antitoxin PrlF [Skermanella aerolata]|uniref:AbrB/MazE/SpoVT family DNA-binding domain-containing protein n=1 Tax=Skermanella aerolata TaxID=393310 RepID=UPI003D1AE78E
MITSKLTKKAQTTVPQAVCTALGLREGDKIAYSSEEGHVVLTRATAEPADDPFHTFTEWSFEADRRAYADL